MQRPSKAKLASRSVNLDWDVEPATLPSTAFSPVLKLRTKRQKLKLRTSLSLPTLPATVYQHRTATKKRPAPLELFSVEPTKTPESKKQRMSSSPPSAPMGQKAVLVGPGKWSALKIRLELEEKRKIPKTEEKAYGRGRRGAVDRSFGDK